MSGEKFTCDECLSEVIEGLGCDCGNYEPGQDRVAYFVAKRTGYCVGGDR